MTHAVTLRRIEELEAFLAVDDLGPVLADLVAGGFNLSQIADKMGMSIHGLKSVLTHFDLDWPGRHTEYGKSRIQRTHGRPVKDILTDLCTAKQTSREIATQLGVGQSTVLRWCNEYGLTPKRPEKPVGHERLVRHNGLEMNVKQWAEHLGLPKSTLSKRLGSGRELKYALVPWSWPKVLEGVNLDILIAMKHASFEPEDLQSLLHRQCGALLGQRQIKQRLRTLQSHDYVRRYIYEDSGKASPFWELTEKGKRVLRGEKP